MAERDKNRWRRRAEGLRRFDAQYDQARTQIRSVYDANERLRSEFAVRRCFTLRRPTRTGPPGARGPAPAADLVIQKGWALHLYLIALFDAQSRRRPGAVITNRRPLRRTDGQPGWIDFLPATTATCDADAGMMRQMTRALTTLERHGLVRVKGRPGSAGRFEQFQVLHESGNPYRVWNSPGYEIPNPRALMPPDPFRPPVANAGNAETLLLPVEFFLNGWVHALSAAEIATYLMLRELETRYPDSARDGVYVTEPTREAWYDLSRDIYESHRQLTDYGLVERLDAPNRSADGKILRKPAGTKYLEPLRFRTLPKGFDQPAVKTVAAALISA